MKFVANFLTFLLVFVRINAKPVKEVSSIVETKYGLVEGSYDGLSRDGEVFHQFFGIQYGVIAERFKSAVEPSPWNGVKQAKQFGATCTDIERHGNENCLFLNVFTKEIKNGTESIPLRPVAVFIHGGSFQLGSGGDFGPNYFMDEDVVLVTINYRLGILGFLSTEDENSPGNYGLKDQSMALKWVRENIENFGGDPEKVTIFGNSAGGASVTYHLVSPMSKGLFSRASAQSGTFLDPWAFTHKPMRYARKVAEVLNCSDSSTGAGIVSCLKNIPAEVLANKDFVRNATIKFFEDPFSAFGPVMEPKIGDGSDTFLSESPYELLVAGNMSNVPLLCGVTKEEGIYIWAAWLLMMDEERNVKDRQLLESNWTGIAPAAFYFDEFSPPSRHQEIAGKIEDFYFNSTGFTLNSNLTFPQLSQLYSDRLFVASAVRFMNLYSKHAPVYPYLYTFNEFVSIEFGWEELHANYSLDATHTAELDMLMSPFYNITRVHPIHDSTSKNITKLWTSFFEGGVPSATYGSERNFPGVNSSTGLQKWYKLDIDTELVDNLFDERIKFWESLNIEDDDYFNCYC